MITYTAVVDHPGGFGIHCMGAYDGSQLVGYITWDEAEDQCNGVVPYVHVLFVEEPYRRQGIARELCRQAVLTRPNRDVVETFKTVGWHTLTADGYAVASEVSGNITPPGRPSIAVSAHG